VVEPREYPALFRHGGRLVESRSVEEIVSDASVVHERAINGYLDWVKGVCRPQEIVRIKKRLTLRTKIADVTKAWFDRMELWSHIVDRVREQSKRQSWGSRLVHAGIELRIFDGFVWVVHDRAKTNYLMVYEQLQMLQDACAARFNTFLAIDLGLHNGSEEIRVLVRKLLIWQEHALNRYSNEAYELIKAPEALCKTHLTRLTGGDILPYSSFARTVDKLLSKEKKMTDKPSIIPELVKFINGLTHIGDTVELFGLIKLSGHPIVYAEKSALSVRSEAMTPDKSVPLAILRAVRAFRHIIISNHISKFGEWPRFKDPPRPGTDLHRHWINHVTTLTMDSYPTSDLDYIKFRKMINFDYSLDFLKMLDDKAINPGAAHAAEFWFRPMDRECEPRRLLLKALSEDKIDMKEIVDRMSQGGFSQDERYVELTQKERELKIAARCFCKLPLTVRMFFVLLEYNLGESLLPIYFPQQTMTMSDSEAKRRLYNMSYATRGRGNAAVLEIDFSRWNLRFRHTFVSSIAMEINSMYGVAGLYSQVHKYFASSTIALTDRHSLPEGVIPGLSAHLWPESDLVWRNHLGGFEGIQQKLWTVCTIVMVYQALSRFDTSFLMAGQGDNQVLVLLFRNNSDRSSILPKLLAELEMRCQMLNHEVKPDECLDSTTVLTYGKEIYIRGVHTQYALKFLSRTFARPDSDLPSVTSEISSICSSAIIGANCIPIPFQGYGWQAFQVLYHLEHLRAYSPNVELRLILQDLLFRGESLLFTLELPGTLGGLPILPWSRFIIRGEVDPLTWDVAAVLRHAGGRANLLRSDLQLLLDGRYKPKEPDVSQLVQDPYSIPLARPKESARIIKEHLKNCLIGGVKNHWLREILGSDVATKGEKLQRMLVTTRPLHPVILSDIYKASLAGLQDDLYGRFVMTRTVQGVTDVGQFLSVIEYNNVSCFAYIAMRLKEARINRTRVCLGPNSAFVICQRLRQQWTSDTSMESLTVDSPLSWDLTKDVTTVPCISAVTRVGGRDLRFSVGTYPPNFGTTTKQKRSDHGYKLMMSSDTLRMIKLVCLISSQLGADGNLRRLLDDLVRSRCPWTLDELSCVMPTVYGGVSAHRHDSLAHQFYGVLGSQTVPTHLSLSSDNSDVLQGGIDDYPVIFQHHYLCLTNLHQVLGESLGTDSPMALGTIVNPAQLHALETDKIILPIYNDLRWRSFPNNALAYLDKLSFERIPTRYPTTHVPALTNEKLSTHQILTSTLLQRASLDLDGSRVKFAILRPTERFDIAELMNVNPWTCLNAVVECSLLLYTKKDLHLSDIFLNEWAGALARQYLHPRLQKADFLRKLMLTYRPGTSRCLDPQSRLYSYLRTARNKHPGASVMMRRNTRVILCSDSPSSGSRTIAIFARLWLAFVGYHLKRDALFRTERVRLLYRRSTEWVGRICASRQLSDRHRGVALIDVVRMSLRILSEETNNHHVAYSAQTWPPFRYTTEDADEFKRRLRVTEDLIMPREIQASPRTVGEVHPVSFSVDPSVYSCSVTSDLSLYPEVPIDQSYSPLHRLRDLHWRGQGIATTAYSVWSTVFQKMRERGIPPPQKAIVVGIGHGAIPAILTSRGCTVYGIDVRSAVPSISQRELLLVPPETAISGDPSQFTWHPSFFSDPNWSCKSTSGCLERTPVDLVVVDVESGGKEMLLTDLLDSCSHCDLLLRTFSNDEILTHLIASCLPDFIIIPKVEPRGASYPVILYTRSTTRTRVTPESIIIRSLGSWNPILRANPDTSVSRFNYRYSPSSVWIEKFCESSLDLAIQDMDEESVYKNDLREVLQFMRTKRLPQPLTHRTSRTLAYLRPSGLGAAIIAGEDLN